MRKLAEAPCRFLRSPPTGLRVGLLLDPPVHADLDPSCARAAEDAARLLEDLGHHVDIREPGLLSEIPWEAFDDVWAVLAAEGVAAGEEILGHPATADDVEPLTLALYERGRALDALSYRRSLARLQRVARTVVGDVLAHDALLTPALAQRRPAKSSCLPSRGNWSLRCRGATGSRP
jgi:Asp-tRNA(Asn)/Glu-tRNA(Gln) amidotransferase A subunit family amidase